MSVCNMFHLEICLEHISCIVLNVTNWIPNASTHALIILARLVKLEHDLVSRYPTADYQTVNLHHNCTVFM